MNKKLSAVFLVTAILLSILSLPVSAYETWIESGAVSLTAVTLSSGEELKSVSGGETVTLSCRMKKGPEAEENQTAQLIAVAYKDGFWCGEGKSELVSLTEKPQTVTAEISVPAEADLLKVYVWDSRESRRPIAETGVAGGSSDVSDVIVRNITVDGESLDGFSSDKYEYDVVLSAAYMNYPEIVVYTSDILAKTEIVCEGAFPSDNCSVVAKVTKNGTTAASYKINFSQEAPEISNIKYKVWKDSSKTDTIYKELDKTVTMTEPSGYDGNLTKNDYYYTPVSDISSSYTLTEKDLPTDMINPMTDRTHSTLYNISPELLGGEMIPMSYGADTVTEIGSPDTLVFDINRSATIYVWANNGGSALASAGFSKTGGSHSTYYKGHPDTSSAVKGVLAMRMQIGKVGEVYTIGRYAMSNWYKKDIIVKPDDDTVTVSIPSTGVKYMCATVKFHDTPIIQNARFETLDGEENTTVLREVFAPVMADSEHTQGDYRADTHYIPLVISNREALGLNGFSDELIGAEAILLPYNMKSNGADNLDAVEFELTHSAKIYFVVQTGGLTDEWLAENKPEWIEEGFSQTDDMVYSFASGAAAPVNTSPNNTIVNEYKVLPGESVTVRLDNLSALRGRIFVFAKRTELE